MFATFSEFHSDMVNFVSDQNPESGPRLKIKFYSFVRLSNRA